MVSARRSLSTGFNKIVQRFHAERFHGILLEGGGEDEVRQVIGLRFAQSAHDAKTVQTGHLHVQERDIGLQLRDERQGFQAVAAGCNYLDFSEIFEEKYELFGGELLVVRP